MFAGERRKALEDIAGRNANGIISLSVADLYLVRHGEARTEGEDAQRTLTPRGEEQIETIARWAARVGFRVDEIRHSGKTRAAQTAAILSRHIGARATAVSGIAPNDDVRAFEPSSGSLMIVSHLPFLSRLASHLLVSDAEREIIALQTGAMAHLVRADAGWRLVWLITPECLP